MPGRRPFPRNGTLLRLPRRTLSRKIRLDQAQIETIDLTEPLRAVVRIGDGMDFRWQTNDPNRFSQPSGITNDQWATDFIDLIVGQGLDDNFGADSSWITYRDSDPRTLTDVRLRK